MADALSAQINLEQYSAQLYLAMSVHCVAKSFPGFGHWLKVQSAEETTHAERLIKIVEDRGGKPALQAIAAPPADFGSILQIFESALEHEKKVTAKIDALVDLARAEKDHATEIALHWFVTEQVEEEANATLIVDHLRAAGDKGGAIYYLDSKLGKRGKS
jgi:ferritin